jgi:predicted AAA+ superfamily ATPase
LLSDITNPNLKSIYENFVCQELQCHNTNPLYYNSKEYGEVEFVIFDRTLGSIIPIIINVAKHNPTIKPINQILDSYTNIKRGYALTDCNVRVDDKVIYLPIWGIGLIQESIS